MIYFSVAGTDILVRVTVKENFSAKALPMYMSIMKTAAGLGASLQTIIYGFLLKAFNWQVCLIVAGIVNNVILVSHWLFVADVPKREPMRSAGGTIQKEKPFTDELMRPVTMCGNIAMLFYFVSFKVMYDWTIKYALSAGLEWEDGKNLIFSLTILSVSARVGSGFIAV